MHGTPPTISTSRVEVEYRSHDWGLQALTFLAWIRETARLISIGRKAVAEMTMGAMPPSLSHSASSLLGDAAAPEYLQAVLKPMPDSSCVGGGNASQRGN